MIKNNILFRLGKIEIRHLSYVFILSAILFGGSESQAQVTGANGPIPWASYMAVYSNLNGAKGGFVFGDGWTVSALQTRVLPSDFNHKLQLFPNYNAYADNPSGNGALFGGTTEEPVHLAINGWKPTQSLQIVCENWIQQNQ